MRMVTSLPACWQRTDWSQRSGRRAKATLNFLEVALALVSYDESYGSGRASLYHRNTSADGKTAQPYVVDPYPHTTASSIFA